MALLGIARIILRKGLTFRSNVELVAFSGEEQGLKGSSAYSREHHIDLAYLLPDAQISHMQANCVMLAPI
jgi:Zn-dependent M28 family amino/carboxypeptidase